MESILETVRSARVGGENDTTFDDELIIHINTAFMFLARIGVGPPKGFRIEDEDAYWTDFIPEDDIDYEGVKTYVLTKVELLFDPPASSTLLQAKKDLLAELEWSLNFRSEINNRKT